MTHPDHLFGIMGLTPGGLGIWVLIAGLAAWWIRGMGDRKRAGSEAMTAESKASEAQYRRLEAEIARLVQRVEKQDARIDELEKAVRECEHHRSVAEAENVQLRAELQLEGRVRQEAAKVVAADRGDGKLKSVSVNGRAE